METLDVVSLPLMTTWPAFTEAMYLLARDGGVAGRHALWRLVESGRLEVGDLSDNAVARSAQLVDTYSDVPMDLADATLVAYAEQSGHRRIFTLDSDFSIYRMHRRLPLRGSARFR